VCVLPGQYLEDEKLIAFSSHRGGARHRYPCHHSGVLMISLPDRSLWWLLLPLLALAMWITTIGYGCRSMGPLRSRQTLGANPGRPAAQGG
jgi:hypothetical protein